MASQSAFNRRSDGSGKPKGSTGALLISSISKSVIKRRRLLGRRAAVVDDVVLSELAARALVVRELVVRESAVRELAVRESVPCESVASESIKVRINAETSITEQFVSESGEVVGSK